jgi:hypothetical protein
MEYLRFALCIASGEYVPVEVTDEHGSLLTRARAVRWKCVTCSKEPVGDHHAHRSHTKDRRFSARANGICDRDLAHVVDTVEVHLQQLQDCINRCFGEGSGDLRDSMTRFGDLKAQALHTWEVPGGRPGFYLEGAPLRFLPDHLLGLALAPHKEGQGGHE